MCTYVVVLWISRATWVGDSPDFRDPSCGTRAVCSTTDVNVYSYAHRTFCHSHKVRVVVPAACLERHRYRRSILTSRGTQRTEPLEASGPAATANGADNCRQSRRRRRRGRRWAYCVASDIQASSKVLDGRARNITETQSGPKKS